MNLADVSIIAWIQENRIANEKGELVEFEDHLFLYDILRDQSQNLVVMKGAQVGMSTTQVLKNHHDAKRFKIDIIYSLPTDEDVQTFVGGKVNRIIASNPCMVVDVADKDSIEQKQIGDSMIYFRGTFTKRKAQMVTADRLVHDEIDSSRPDVIADYQARLQHSKLKQTHVFSHPSLPNTGVHAFWLKSDQKHWVIKCPHCSRKQDLSWNVDDASQMSVDLESKQFVCKACHGILSDTDRAVGEWVAQNPGAEWSGYWVPLLIAPWVSAKEIVDKFSNPETTQEFFYTKMLGLPYADGQSKLLQTDFESSLTGKAWAPASNERVVIGIDTGLRLDFVLGTEKGLFHHGDSEDYDELDGFMRRWPNAIAIVDQGGDLIGSRKFKERWPGRVFLCGLVGDRSTENLIRWGSGDESGAATADRNRVVSLLVGEIRDGRVPLHGSLGDWWQWWLDWSALSRVKVVDPATNVTRGHKWVRSGRDHRAMATVFWRVGMSRFSGTGGLAEAVTTPDAANSYEIAPDGTASFNPTELLGGEDDKHDWRLQQ